MKKLICKTVSAALIAALMMGVAGCGQKPAEEPAQESQVANSSEMAEVADVVQDWMVPVYGDELVDGVYPVQVDSSSEMFNITDCELTVENGEMQAVMTMGGKGYLYVFMGTGEEAVNADESQYIPYEESGDVHTFTVPVEALDFGLDCAAFSKKKEKWYDRTLVFRADSLPDEAFAGERKTAPAALNLADGTYSVDVTLDGGSGKASVESPAQLTVQDGVCTVRLVWSSSKYDYMKVNDVKYDPVTLEGGSTFEIPVDGFDYRMPVLADTTAMSTPHEIEYTIYLDSATIQAE